MEDMKNRIDVRLVNNEEDIKRHIENKLYVMQSIGQ